jgi:AraC-like DNA-binding protein
MKTLNFDLPATILKTGEVSEWLSAEKMPNSYRPLSKDLPGNFSFSAQSVGQLVGWSGSSSICRSLSVELESDDYMLFVDHGAGHGVKTGSETHAVGHAKGLLTSADRYSGVEIIGGSVAEGFAISKLLVHKALFGYFDVPVPRDFEFVPSLDLQFGPTMRLLQLVKFFRTEICAAEEIEVSSIVLTNFEDMLCMLMAQNMPHSLSGRPSLVHSIAPFQVRRAMEFARANAALPITAVDMASAAGVSRRSLEVNFRRFLDMTPMSYLRYIRFEGARRELIEADPLTKVSEISRRWGFVHMGRFATEYRLHFGVAPSFDLARAISHQKGSYPSAWK